MTKAERLQRVRGLYGIVDDGPGFSLPPLDWAKALAQGGASVLQLRFKRQPMRDALSLARRIREAVPGVVLIVDDRPDLALLANADGVHVGEDDLPPADVRRIVGPELLVGATARNAHDGKARLAEGADHLGVGPVFPTRTKTVDHPSLGLDQLRAICREIDAPIVAIAGIGLDNIGSVAAAGARAAAVVSAVGSAADPAAAARALRERFLEGAS